MNSLFTVILNKITRNTKVIVTYVKGIMLEYYKEINCFRQSVLQKEAFFEKFY